MASETGGGGTSPKVLVGGALSVMGLLMAVLGFVIPFITNGVAVFFGGLGIALGIAGYALGARRLGTAAIVLCAIALFFGLAASQGFIPGMEGASPREREIGPS